MSINHTWARRAVVASVFAVGALGLAGPASAATVSAPKDGHAVVKHVSRASVPTSQGRSWSR